MKVFIWYVDKCSDNYHSDGGVIVFANTEERAREIANDKDGCEIRDDEMPEDVREASGEERVFIFPNAGCC
jgi:hypothetical protein